MLSELQQINDSDELFKSHGMPSCLFLEGHRLQHMLWHMPFSNELVFRFIFRNSICNSSNANHVQSLWTTKFTGPSETICNICNKITGYLTCNKRLESAGDRLPFSDWLINVIEKLSFWIGSIQICSLTRIHYRATTNCDKCVKIASLGKFSSFLQTVNI